MTTRDIARLIKAGALIGRCAYPKPTHPSAADGVEGGIIVAADPDGAGLVVALHGRLDDLYDYGPTDIDHIDDEDWWDMSEGRSTDASRWSLDSYISDTHLVHPHVARLIGRGVVAPAA